ncbi:MAG: winged helix-turn-helix domain-containing protein [Gemmatimonadaceae bacterium]
MGGVLTFGPFHLDLGNCELRRDGIPVRLQPQPFRVLSLLVRNGGRLVTRDRIRADVWGSGTFLDFDQSLNYCIRQIRSALDDDVSAPRYVETRQRLGYRFVAPVAELIPKPEPAAGGKIMLVVLPFQNLSGAEEQDYRALEIDPGYTRAHYCLGLVYEQQGRYGSAIDAFRKALRPRADGPGPRAALAHCYGLAGERRKVLAVSRELEQISAKAYVSPYDFVLTSLALGDTDRTMSWLTRAYEARSSYIAFVRTDPRLAPLHSDPRFAELVRSMEFPE